MYKYFYNTPNSFSNIVMTSDGEFFAGLWFENSIDEFKHCGNLWLNNYQYLMKLFVGWICILVGRFLLLYLSIK